MQRWKTAYMRCSCNTEETRSKPLGLYKAATSMSVSLLQPCLYYTQDDHFYLSVIPKLMFDFAECKSLQSWAKQQDNECEGSRVKRIAVTAVSKLDCHFRKCVPDNGDAT